MYSLGNMMRKKEQTKAKLENLISVFNEHSRAFSEDTAQTRVR